MQKIILCLIFAIAINCVDYGMDVSVWQGTIDWAAARSTGLNFAIARASYGLSTDGTFAENWRGMVAHGVKPGAYHYYVPGDDAAAQARHFASVIKSVAGSYSSSYVEFKQLAFVPAALDIEVTGGLSAAQISANCLTFLRTLQSELGYQPMLYTYVSFGDSYLTDSQLASFPLWIANWGVSSPSIPGAWRNAGKSCLYWQYADNGAVSGVSGKVDRDRTY